MTLIEKIKILPNSRPGLASGLCESLDALGVAIFFLVNHILGKDFSIIMLACVYLGCKLATTQILKYWVATAKDLEKAD